MLRFPPISASMPAPAPAPNQPICELSDSLTAGSVQSAIEALNAALAQVKSTLKV